jgi:hypothetical protein
MVRIRFALLAAGALFFGLGSQASAQSSRGWWEPVVLDQSGDVGSILRDAVLGRQSDRGAQGRQDARVPDRVVNRNNGGRNGGGPPFCRNGQGHPVHGRRWCQDKGWVGGSTWAREGWADVILGGGVPEREREVGSSTIGSILGDVILGRVTRFGREAGLGGSVDGRWLPISSGGSVLQLRMGGVPIAELADLNRDGRAEVVLLNHAY